MTKNINGQMVSRFLCKGLVLGLLLTVSSAMSLSYVKPAIAQSKQQNANTRDFAGRRAAKITRDEAKEIIARYFDTTVDNISFEEIKLRRVKNMDHVSQKKVNFRKNMAVGTPYYEIACSYDTGDYDIAVHGESGKIVNLILKDKGIF